MKSLFEENTYAEITSRLNQLDESSERQWGKMTVSQMLHHCQLPLALALKEHTLEKPSWFMKIMGKFFKKTLYNDSEWKKNLPTPARFKVIEDKNFGQEKDILSGLINRFHDQKEKKNWDPHPVFGHFTVAQWGQMQYKHLDHHFRQFGV
ncbi:hypothetical protein GCM10009117_26940 [Gangjinia marincola]|uniref:DUF1569 domain-containing protein n=1 Tax=Gangjinia marincola TaxID=578463 RepID=A0ABN1MK21_9FLAO